MSLEFEGIQNPNAKTAKNILQLSHNILQTVYSNIVTVVTY